jgi:hypothetical protein
MTSLPNGTSGIPEGWTVEMETILDWSVQPGTSGSNDAP